MITKLKLWLLSKLIFWYRKRFEVGSENYNAAFEIEVSIAQERAGGIGFSQLKYRGKSVVKDK